MHYILRLFVIGTALSMAACQTTSEPATQQAEPVEPTVQAPPPKPKVIIQPPTAEPILNPKKSDILFAQTSLKALGYPIGKVDGVWGKKSEAAMILFEKNQNIQSANGKLSTLNLYELQNTHEPLKHKSASVSRSLSNPSQTQANRNQEQTNIANKLSYERPNRNAPELVIVDHGYAILAKPNPYSAKVTQIEAGTGVYILSNQNGWYEVETTNNQRGYIKD